MMQPKPSPANATNTALKATLAGTEAWDLLEALPIGVYTCDKEGYIVSFNKAAVELWGRQPDIGRDKWFMDWKLFRTDGTVLPYEESPMGRTLQAGKVVEGRSC
ncbi:PAS domain-containing protein [Mucilaginibacter sp. CAU 1740]|uniref:PAS domain-containing protein n=1 Tax=Mucilaginibacter sp. CAU 1740 TaxID=3140365 RepID=UPI00325ADBF4